MIRYILIFVLSLFISTNYCFAQGKINYLGNWQTSYLKYELNGSTAKAAFGTQATAHGQTLNPINPLIVAKSESVSSGLPPGKVMFGSAQVDFTRKIQITGCPKKGSCKLTVNKHLLPKLEGKFIIANPFLQPSINLASIIRIRNDNPQGMYGNLTDLFEHTERLSFDNELSNPSKIKHPLTPVEKKVKVPLDITKDIVDGTYTVSGYLYTNASLRPPNQLLGPGVRLDKLGGALYPKDLYEDFLRENTNMNDEQIAIAISQAVGKAESRFFDSLELELTVESNETIGIKTIIGLILLILIILILYSRKRKTNS